MSDEKKAEYLKKLRMSCQQKKDVASLNVNINETPSSASLLESEERTPFKDISNTSKGYNIIGVVDPMIIDQPTPHNQTIRKKPSSQGWYARLSDEKKAQHLEKQRKSRKQKKDDALSVSSNKPQPSTPVFSPDIGLMGSGQSVITKLIGIPSVGATACTEHPMPEDDNCDWLKRNDAYQRKPSLHSKDAHFVDHIGCALPDIIAYAPSTNQQGQHTPMSLVPNAADTSRSSESKRLREKERYSSMSPDQKDARLNKMREYNKRRRSAAQSHGVVISIGDSVTSNNSDQLAYNKYDMLHAGLCEAPKYHPNMTAHNDQDDDIYGIFEPSVDHPSHFEDMKCTRSVADDTTGQTTQYPTPAPANENNDEDDPDTYGIFEPDGQRTHFEECMDAVRNGESEDELDEEARIFVEQHVRYESYRVKQQSGNLAPTENTDDRIYHGLPKKHHVLRKVRDCEYCGAMRIQYEGPAFCCRKGKVGVVILEVPSELKRLFTSQKDKDAIYFRANIRYFNSHFSFTSLGVTLDQRVCTAKGTGIYTFRAHGQLYHRLDDLVPGDKGPRHLQLYIYDTDESLGHRAQRSPDLSMDLIRKILTILEKNPYVETFRSVGSVPNLDEYRIALNTDISLDQRRYNAPTASQVAAIWVEGSNTQNYFDRSVVVHGRGDRSIYIRAYYGCYDPLAYPLFFPHGETGWNRWMPYVGEPDHVC